MTKNQREVQFHSKAHRDGPQPTDEEFHFVDKEPCCGIEEGECCFDEDGNPPPEFEAEEEGAEEAPEEAVLT